VTPALWPVISPVIGSPLTIGRAHWPQPWTPGGCPRRALGECATAVSYLREARQIAEKAGDLDDLFRAYLNLSDLLVGPLNRLDEGLAVALDGARQSTRRHCWPGAAHAREQRRWRKPTGSPHKPAPSH
jgi:hypothetical protein